MSGVNGGADDDLGFVTANEVIIPDGGAGPGTSGAMTMDVGAAHDDGENGGSLFPLEALRAARNPWTAFFHLFFKGSAILVYILCSWFTSSFILSFILCLLLLAADFWVVKNISGRLLVGLRWSNVILDDGSSEWRFESIPDTSRVGKLDYRVFWWGQIIAMLLWILLLLYAFITFKFTWIIIVIIALALTGSNLWGYFMCSRADTGAAKAAEQARSWAAGAALSAAAQNPGMMGRVMGIFSSSSGGGAAAASAGEAQNLV